MFEVTGASRAGGAAPNEDLFRHGDAWALVLDGITRYPDDGCTHDVPWYVDGLGAAIAERVEDARVGLKTVLAEAIAAVSGRHSGSCDLENPVTPGATVGIARVVEERVEWLVLGDCEVSKRGRDPYIVGTTDGRLLRVPDRPESVDVGGVRRWPVEYVARVRNREGGYWVAAADPGAAAMAFTGSWPVESADELLLCTDGLTRLYAHPEYTSHLMFEVAAAEGVEALIDLVREFEEHHPAAGGWSKRHDDATGVLVRLR